MFCPKCGSQSPDGTQFCPKCGGNLSAPQQQQYPNAEQQYQNMGQQYPNAGQQYQNMGQQYPNAGQQYPNMGQPAYGAPVYGQMQPKKSAAVPIAIICSVAVILTVFLILLFTVILPGQSDKSSDNPSIGSSQGQSVESKMKRRWSDQYGENILDLRNNTIESDGMVIRITWKLNGDDSILITGVESNETIEASFYLNSNGNELNLIWNGEVEILKPVD